MTITVREAQERDIDLLVEMNRIVHQLHVEAAPAYFTDPKPEAVAELFRFRLRQSEIGVWVASVSEVAAGYAVSAIRERPGNAICLARRFCELDEIAVAATHRKRGVARALVGHVLADAHAQGVRDVELTAWSFNSEARAAFAALGFRPMTVRFHHVSGPSGGDN